MRTYSDLIKLESFKERLQYLQLLDNNALSPRHMSMGFYKTRVWKVIRDQVITRDVCFDLGVDGVYIDGPIFVHHMNPIEEHDIIYKTDKLLNPEYLITCSLHTHNMIHYGTEIEDPYVERKPSDTILW